MTAHPVVTDAPLLRYQSGFNNECASEALPGALPVGRNSPQRCPYGLYAEQINGTAFTAPRADNRRSWLYRIRPTAVHEPFVLQPGGRWLSDFSVEPATPQPLRWDPLPEPAQPVDFVDAMVTLAGSGDPHAQSGLAVHVYAASRSMVRRAFYNADGELLILVQQGLHRFVTELGILEAGPQQLVVIPKGIRFRVELPEGIGRGYVCENYGAPLRLPDLGVIGSNGLANPRDFEAPVAAYEEDDGDWRVTAKFMGRFWNAAQGHSPFDVVAWHGNHTPYRYDLRRYNTIGSISHDHPDPSIFLVLHSASDTPGVSAIDFVVFTPRVLAMRDTFRPPWFHRNIASEFMGLLHGVYDAKAQGFVPGGASLHNAFTGHGPDAETFRRASHSDTTRPDYLADTMAFMFESRTALRPTTQAMQSAQLQPDYHRCWQGLQRHFDPLRPDACVPPPPR